MENASAKALYTPPALLESQRAAVENLGVSVV